MPPPLGNTLQTAFQRSGELIDLNEAIDAMLLAVSATQAADSDYPRRLSNLAVALRARFERSGALDDLDEAIRVGRCAVAAIQRDHPDSAAVLTNLGVTLVARFLRSGARVDLDDAIQVDGAAVAATPAGHPNYGGRLSNLAVALRTRYERFHEPDDLGNAIRCDRAAVAATPDGHPRRPAVLTNFATTLRTAFRLSGAPSDLDGAIQANRAAIAATPDGHPRRAAMLSDLGVELLTRSERDAAPSDAAPGDLDEAVEVSRAAATAVPADQPERAAILSRLAVALHARYERSGVTDDLGEAVRHCLAAVEVPLAEPSVRIRAAWLAAMLTGPAGSPGMASVLGTAVELLPELAPRHLPDRGDRQRALSGYAGLASAAASLALSDDSLPAPQRAGRALRLLETGRAVLLSQALDTRTDLTDLRDQHPELAKRFTQLRDRLDGPEDPDALTAGPRADPGNLRALNGELNAVLDRIRSQPGFASFARLPDLDELVTQAAEGPVVTFNVSVYRSDALLLTKDGITAVELPRLDIGALTHRVSAFHQALNTAADPLATTEERRKAQDVLLEILGWLWECAAEPVLDALGCHRQPPAGEWPRVWWATGGLLGLLPMHAAGHHLRAPAGQAVIDRVISSYTPTVRALRYARQQAGRSRASSRSLIVAMPTTPGQEALPYAAAEAATLAAVLPAPTVLIEPDPVAPGDALAPDSRTPTFGAVLERLPRCAFAHFACHGAHDLADPSRSHLLLHDHATAPLTIASLAAVRLEHAELAFLSACRTAFHNAEELLDETIHLAVAFQLAGFPRVIATLWEVYDRVAVTMADNFYAGLRTGKAESAIHAANAAQALHHAIRAQRKLHRDLPSRWAAYLHVGA